MKRLAALLVTRLGNAKRAKQLTILVMTLVSALGALLAMPAILAGPDWLIWVFAGLLLAFVVPVSLLSGEVEKLLEREESANAASSTPASQPPLEQEPPSFWPTRDEVMRYGYAALLFLFIAFSLLAPYALLTPLWFLPPGDGFALVLTRTFSVSLFAFFYYWWLGRLVPTLAKRIFDGKLPRGFENAFVDTPRQPPETITQILRGRWQWLVSAAFAFAIAIGWITLDWPGLDTDGGPKRVRSMLAVLQWCQGNPNTTRVSAFLIGVASLAYIALPCVRILVRSREAES